MTPKNPHFNPYFTLEKRIKYCQEIKPEILKRMQLVLSIYRDEIDKELQRTREVSGGGNIRYHHYMREAGKRIEQEKWWNEFSFNDTYDKIMREE